MNMLVMGVEISVISPFLQKQNKTKTTTNVCDGPECCNSESNPWAGGGGVVVRTLKRKVQAGAFRKDIGLM